MNKFLILLALFCFTVAILGYNFLKKCSEYGGVVGKIRQCACYGIEVEDPAKKLGIDERYSSTMCVGLQFDKPMVSLPKSSNPRCNEKIETGSCLAYIAVFEYNSVTNSCDRGIWGGCGGNVPFKTEQECLSTCVYYRAQ